MRSLTEIAAREQEVRKALRDVRLAINNKRDSLARDEAEEAKLLSELDDLAGEATAAFDRARAIGQGDAVEAPPALNVFEQRLDAAFDRATTPQGNGVAF